MDAERQRIINEAARQVNEIEQLFIDTAQWNHLHPNQEPVDPDPDGLLARIKKSMEGLLKSEASLGNYPSVLPMKARPRKYIPLINP